MSDNFSKADELKKLKDLVDDGALTQEEFDAQKKLLLVDDPAATSSSGVNPPLTAITPPAPLQPGKKNSGCLVAFLIVVVLFVGIILVLRPTIKLGGANSAKQPSSAVSQTKEEILEFDDRTWEDFKKLYVSHNNLIENVVAFSNGQISEVDLYELLVANKKYFASTSLSFGYGQTEDEKAYLNVFESAALSDQLVAESVMKYLDTLKTSDLATVKSHIEKSKAAYSMIASNRGILLVKAGLTQEELNEKVTKDIAELEDSTGSVADSTEGQTPTTSPTSNAESIDSPAPKVATARSEILL